MRTTPNASDIRCHYQPNNLYSEILQPHIAAALCLPAAVRGFPPNMPLRGLLLCGYRGAGPFPSPANRFRLYRFCSVWPSLGAPPSSGRGARSSRRTFRIRGVLSARARGSGLAGAPTPVLPALAMYALRYDSAALCMHPARGAPSVLACASAAVPRDEGPFSPEGDPLFPHRGDPQGISHAGSALQFGRSVRLGFPVLHCHLSFIQLSTYGFPTFYFLLT